MQIVKTPNSILTKKVQLVGKIDSKLTKIIEEMKVVLKNSKIGVGLAAPQVGVSLAIFIAAPNLMYHTKKKKVVYHVFINPNIEKMVIGNQNSVVSKSPANNAQPKTDDRKPNTTLEGCLSIPDIWGRVARSPKVTLSYLDEKGISHVATFTGFMATIVQHEMDHLNGILFTHHVIAQGEQLYEQVKDEKTGKLVMEAVEI